MWALGVSCEGLVGREGIEPPQSKTADLQSAELTTCSTYPLMQGDGPRLRPRGEPGTGLCNGADDGTRTRNRRFTKPLLYQLSYVGAQEHTAEDTWAREIIGAEPGSVKRADGRARTARAPNQACLRDR